MGLTPAFAFNAARNGVATFHRTVTLHHPVAKNKDTVHFI
jgi:hypothetical protein